MKLWRDLNDGLNFSWLENSIFHSLRIRTKLLMALIPSTILILVATGIVTNWFSGQFLNEAIQRTVRLQTLALAHEVETFLNQCREDVLTLSRQRLDEYTLRHFFASRKEIRGWAYAEAAYLSKGEEESVYLIEADGVFNAVPSSEISLIRPDPRETAEKLQPLGNNGVWISPVIEAIYPVKLNSPYRAPLTNKVIRFTTLHYNHDGVVDGLVLLSVSALGLRDILSLFNSPHSPIFAYIRSPELRYSYLVDSEGWIWFQSRSTQTKPESLSTHVARTGFSGTFGKPGLESAFRPLPQHTAYWQMVKDIQQGKHGIVAMKDEGDEKSSVTDTFFVSYAPIQFVSSPGQAPGVYAGVAFVDRSRLGLWAGYRQIDVIFVITLLTTLLISAIIVALSRIITRPILRLAAAVNTIQETGEFRQIELRDHDYETSFLKYSINNMLSTITQQVAEIRIKDEKLLESTQRERAKLEDEIRTLKQNFLFQNIQDIVGLGPVIESLKTDILKAASVEADVLLIGETGTGKQLTAEAIHKNSSRANQPFVSVNCGALDENLLLDELFGHVKGAFTEAKTDRKGAFLAADGGTLFLDEIGTASPKVQQSLLRAIAMRKISPLGSDREFDVDVRVIAATNEELKAMVEQGRFREDLYYRLNVITIRSPALRDHKEDIPILADHFLKEAGRQMNKQYIGLTQGALEKLKGYHWPGNVRELKNCITRAVAMAEGSLIHTQDIALDVDDSANTGNGSAEPPTDSAVGFPAQHPPLPLVGVRLNKRQEKILSVLLEAGEISRSEYQQIVGDGLPTRTAVYDLQDLVKKGIVRKVGRGPAVRYRLNKI
ncbi:sigma 54-interacting transcriptional regulator [Desulfoferrobacter suflitae]|uniref:sigma 54-interacting transcriptional regulator n=1 Tax=Desulfoferrobacter suflitae TaxID=2865782 RepID=UPI002164A598|nr:sigma 54-interacting transcriptional regulator [Desulfoferrobacter suflitae]MCK8601618.1 sigma 54-interacting transcriptional regulator [Desulfoferrobacter suflitae]